MNNNVVQEQNQVRVETNVKKIYLVDNKNDIQQKQAQEELKKKLSNKKNAFNLIGRLFQKMHFFFLKLIIQCIVRPLLLFHQ